MFKMLTSAVAAALLVATLTAYPVDRRPSVVDTMPNTSGTCTFVTPGSMTIPDCTVPDANIMLASPAGQSVTG